MTLTGAPARLHATSAPVAAIASNDADLRHQRLTTTRSVSIGNRPASTRPISARGRRSGAPSAPCFAGSVRRSCSRAPGRSCARAAGRSSRLPPADYAGRATRSRAPRRASRSHASPRHTAERARCRSRLAVRASASLCSASSNWSWLAMISRCRAAVPAPAAERRSPTAPSRPRSRYGLRPRRDHEPRASRPRRERAATGEPANAACITGSRCAAPPMRTPRVHRRDEPRTTPPTRADERAHAPQDYPDVERRRQRLGREREQPLPVARPPTLRRVPEQQTVPPRRDRIGLTSTDRDLRALLLTTSFVAHPPTRPSAAPRAPRPEHLLQRPPDRSVLAPPGQPLGQRIHELHAAASSDAITASPTLRNSASRHTCASRSARSARCRYSARSITTCSSRS